MGSWVPNYKHTVLFGPEPFEQNQNPSFTSTHPYYNCHSYVYGIKFNINPNENVKLESSFDPSLLGLQILKDDLATGSSNINNFQLVVFHFSGPLGEKTNMYKQ